MKGPCVVCNGPPKYRCPNCGHLYCSLPCYKRHQEKLCSTRLNPLEDKVKDEKQARDKTEKERPLNGNMAYDVIGQCTQEEREEGELSGSDGMEEDDCEIDADFEDLVPQEQLQKLDTSQHLRNLMCNKHLKEMILRINESKSPAALIQQFMQIPIFVEFADECLNTISLEGNAADTSQEHIA